MQKYITNNSGFSIIEVLIGIFVFSLGLISIYALLASSLSINTYNKNAIIASNLAREQVELFRNIRDTNYTKLQVWKQKNPGISYNS
jgi:Tfp pilus assembly protein PilV